MARQPPRVRRAYYDCRYGQLHMHTAMPAGGGFDELTTLLCIHGAGETGRVFAPLLQPLGFARSVHAPDLPGSGESDAAPGIDPVEAATNAVADFIDVMRIRRFDLLARQDGCDAALRLLAGRGAAVRRVVLMAPPTPPKAGPAVTVLSSGEADPASLAARLVSLLADPT